MALRNGSIRDYLRPMSYPSKAPTSLNPKKNPAHVDIVSTELADGDHKGEHLSELEPVDQIPRETAPNDLNPLERVTDRESAPTQSSKDRVINGSDDEDSNSDSSLEDIYVALQQQSRPKDATSPPKNFKSSEEYRTRNKRTRALIQPPPSKPKYKFDMSSLIEQAERHKATEASALSISALLDSNGDELQDHDRKAMDDSILQSVIAEKGEEGVDPGKFLQAVKRMEMSRHELGWRFFDPSWNRPPRMNPALASVKKAGWKAMLADSISKDQILLSGFARDMVTLEGTLDRDFGRWILDEICFEHRNDRREAYCKILESTDQQMGSFITRNEVKHILENLGAKEAAFDINEEVKLIPMDQSPFQDRDWNTLAAVISFLGRISKYMSTDTTSYIMCILTRMCIDSVIIENTNLFVAVHKTMEQVCGKIASASWETVCQEIGSSNFHNTKSPTLQLQILRCIPQTTRRVHELRRRLAQAFFFGEVKYISNAPHESLNLSKITEELKKPRFMISKDTDYVELAALISILNIAIDNGLSTRHDITDSEGETTFNREVDILAVHIKQIWGSINDAGAAFMLRSYAKEMLEGLRMRLEFIIRTRPKPKSNVFDTHESDGDRIFLKQTTLSRKLFQKKPIDDDIS